MRTEPPDPAAPSAPGGGRGRGAGSQRWTMDLSKPVLLSACGEYTKKAGFYELVNGQLIVVSPLIGNRMRVFAGILLAAGALAACSIGPPPEAPRESAARGMRQDDVVVERSAEYRETNYTIAAGECRIVWTVFGTESNRRVIRHRAGCGLPLREQAPMIGRLLRRVMSSEVGAAELRTLDWGRLYPDGVKDETLAVRLAIAAKRSEEWDTVKGVPRNGDMNGWARKVANAALIYRELLPVFLEAGMEIQISAVEKVLVDQAGQLPFYEELRLNGVRADDRVPFDFQAWFSVLPVSGKLH